MTKIALMTTLPSLIENKRIEEEVIAKGFEFKLINLKDLNFSIVNGKLSIENISELKVDYVIVRGIFNSIKTISLILTDLRSQGIKVFDNNFLEHRYSIDKVLDIMKLSLKGIVVPDTYYVRTFSKYPVIGDKLKYPIVVKSTRMGKGVGVYKLDGKAELKKFIKDRQTEGKESKSYIMQEFVDYVYDLRALIIGENVFVMQRIPARGEFRANFSLGGKVKLFDLDNEGRKLAKQALTVVGMSVGGVDILITKDNKRYILEVNHTAGFVGMEKATGVNIGKLFVEHAIAQAR